MKTEQELAMGDRADAKRVLALLDLTDLAETASEAGTLQLCEKAKGRSTAAGGGRADACAAVCVWPQFVKIAHRALAGSGVKVATVVNFPAGGTHIDRVVGDIAEAIDDGADEIDLVFPWKAFLSGDIETAGGMVSEAKATTGARTLKVILETGSFADASSLRAAAELAIESGADFLKTSTGKTAVSATPEAARTLLETIKEAGKTVGFKASGGIRNLAEARAYLALADEIMGEGWATPATFRFGASSLHGALIQALSGSQPGERADGAY
jgi:deoxyribose-phosphate aldolase